MSIAALRANGPFQRTEKMKRSLERHGRYCRDPMRRRAEGERNRSRATTARKETHKGNQSSVRSRTKMPAIVSH
jgi:hypothetical protein